MSDGQQQGFPVFMAGMPQQQGSAEEPPARVLTALRFLGDLTMKQMTRAAANSIEIREIDSPDLTKAEQLAQASACNLLNEYFVGKLEPNCWEAVGLRGKLQKSEGMLLRCIACQGGNAYGCTVCKGTGRVIVYPSGEGGGQ